MNNCLNRVNKREDKEIRAGKIQERKQDKQGRILGIQQTTNSNKRNKVNMKALRS
jgi:hypothetical protein